MFESGINLCHHTPRKEGRKTLEIYKIDVATTKWSIITWNLFMFFCCWQWLIHTLEMLISNAVYDVMEPELCQNDSQGLFTNDINWFRGEWHLEKSNRSWGRGFSKSRCQQEAKTFKIVLSEKQSKI